jgi:uncharacterized surface protein with fasciclin (FAS1) repeats
MDKLHDGRILFSALKLDTLEGHYQALRIGKHNDNVYVNMYAKISEEIAAKNGRVYVLEEVLIPPPDVIDALYALPSSFSTFLSAVSRAGLEGIMKKEHGISVLAPTNRAWERLGFTNLAYLFSCEAGLKDLAKIVRYHVARSLVYSRYLHKKDQGVKLDTLMPGQSLHLQAYEDGRGRDNEKIWRITVNDDQSRVLLADAPVSNGVVHVVSDILIPSTVKLPEDVSD